VICPGFANRLCPEADFGASRGYAGRGRRVDLSRLQTRFSLSPREQRASSVSGILRITGKGRGGRAPPAKWRTAMNAQKTHADALSDKELNAVSGGKDRVQVTKEQYEQILEVRMMFANLKK
jgi:bacteriocin-like protein